MLRFIDSDLGTCANVFEVLLEELAVINNNSAWCILYENWFANSSLCKINEMTELLLAKHN